MPKIFHSGILFNLLNRCKIIKVSGKYFLNQLAHDKKLCRCQSNLGTDKQYIHSYLNRFYGPLFNYIKVPNKLLEIGIYRGASIVLWHNLFPNAEIHGVDIQMHPEMHPEFVSIQSDKEILITVENAYKSETYFTGAHSFDVIIDDGPHTLESQIQALKYRSLLSKDGVLIIEDVPDIGRRLLEIRSTLPEHERKFITGVSFALISGRYDDSILVFSKDISILEWIETHIGYFSKLIGSSALFFRLLKPLIIFGRIRRFIFVKIGTKSTGVFCKQT